MDARVHFIAFLVIIASFLGLVIPVVLTIPVPMATNSTTTTNTTTTTKSPTTTTTTTLGSSIATTTTTTTTTTSSSTTTTTTTTPSGTCACTRVVDNTFSLALPASQRGLFSNADGTLLAFHAVGPLDASYFLTLYDLSTLSLVYPSYQLLLGGGWTSFLVGYSISPHVDMLGRYYWMGNVQTLTVNFAIARLTTGGLLDTSYGTGGRLTFSAVGVFEVTTRGPVDPVTGLFAVATSLTTANNYAEIDIFTGAVTTSTVSISYPSLSDFFISAVSTGMAGGSIILSSGTYACWIGNVVFYPDVPLCFIEAITVDNGDWYATGVISLDGVLFQSFAAKVSGGTTLAWTTAIPLITQSVTGSGLGFFSGAACITIVERQQILDGNVFVFRTFDKQTGAITSSITTSLYVSNFYGITGVPDGPAYIGNEPSPRRVICQT